MRHPRGRSKKSLRPRKTETENSTSAAHLRSSKGRRPPYFPLKPSRPIDEVPIEELELCDIVSLRAYEDGTAQTQGIRAWNEEHEAILRWTYAPGSPCIIDPTDPNQHVSFLSELGFASRDRGRSAVEGQAQSVHLFFNTTDYENCRTKWKTLSTEDREEILLKTLADLARAEEREGNEIEHEGFFLRNRRLTPELTLSSLCADGGDGLLRWFDLIDEYTKDPRSLGVRPIPNEKVFAKFAIPLNTDSPQIPLSMADRALQEEFLLRRHSLLFKVARALPLVILGINFDHWKFCPVGNIRSEIVSNNDPHLADEGEYGATGPLPKEYGYFCTEACSLCHKTASEVNRRRLLYCAGCKKVDRIHAYCSELCQKMDWAHHRKKGQCGSKLSSFLPIPVIGDPTSRTSPTSASMSPDLPPLRQAVLATLDRREDALWAFSTGACALLHIENGGAKEHKLRKQIRRLAYKALNESDGPSIQLLARIVINPNYTPCSSASAPPRTKKKQVPRQKQEEKSKSTLREEEFREMFDLNDDDKWIEALEAGGAELAKDDNKLLKDYAEVMRRMKNGKYVEDERSRILDHFTPTLPDGAPPEIYDMMRGMLAMMLGPRDGQSKEDYSKELFGSDEER